MMLHTPQPEERALVRRMTLDQVRRWRRRQSLSFWGQRALLVLLGVCLGVAALLLPVLAFVCFWCGHSMLGSGLGLAVMLVISSILSGLRPWWLATGRRLVRLQELRQRERLLALQRVDLASLKGSLYQREEAAVGDLCSLTQLQTGELRSVS